MRIAMIGTGYVGLVSGACFSDFGHDVVCVDKDEGKIARLKQGQMPIYEPGLDVLVGNNVEAGRLSFTTDLAEGIAGADAVFIAVGTPTRRGDGFADLTYVYAAAEEIADALDGYAVIVNKSTVPVGTGAEVERLIRARRPDAAFDVASNPEFLREGAAIEDFKRPDRVVVGTTSPRAVEVMRELYRPLSLNEVPMVFTSRETAELTKYAANAFLATKITFINEVADICEKVGADVQQVARGIGLDGRIGSKFLHAGPGYGGSCFPKDTMALVHTAREAGAPFTIVQAVVDANAARKQAMADRIIAACNGVQGAKIAVLGLAFKPNTDDMRDAPSLDILPRLIEAGATVAAFDPESMEEARKHFGDTITYCDDAYATMPGADAVVILTEWNEFRALDLKRIGGLLKKRIMVDLRNVYQPSELIPHGFAYHSIGRASIAP